MEIYVQETASLLFLKRIPASSRDLVLLFAHLFPSVFRQVRRFATLGLAPSAWQVLLVKEEAWK